MLRKICLFLICLLSLQSGFGQPPYPAGWKSEIQLSVDDQMLICGKSTIDFGSQLVGSTAEQIVTITNTGITTLTIYGYDLSGFQQFSGAFEFPAEGTIHIPAGESISFTITYRPDSPGQHQGWITIQSSDPNHQDCTISLIGQGVDPDPLFLRFTDDPLAGYEEVECDGEAFFDITNTPDGTFTVHYSFRNSSSSTIVVRAETTVIGQNITNILNPVTLGPDASGYQGATFHLDAGEIYTILTTLFITLEDGSELTCEHRVIVDKRVIPLTVRFSHDPAQGYTEIECGEEAFFDLTNGPDGTFSVHYPFRNVSAAPIVVRAETTVIGGIITNVLDPVTLEPGASGYQGATFHLEAGEIYTILTTLFITLEDGSELTCEHRVIVDKRVIPLAIIFSHDPAQGYHTIECGGEEFFDNTNTPDGTFSVHYTFQNTSSSTIIVRAETTVIGQNITNVLNPVTLEPGASGYQGATFHLDAGEVYTILNTLFITLEDGSELTCEHRVIVDKTTEIKPSDGDSKNYSKAINGNKLYPTVASQQLTLETLGLQQGRYDIFNSQGQLVWTGAILQGQIRTEIPTAELVAGQYFLRLHHSSQILRFIISKN